MKRDRSKYDSYPTYPASHEKIFMGDDLYGLYRHDSMRNPRIGEEETRALVELIQKGLAAQTSAEKNTESGRDYQVELGRIAARGIEARNKLVEANTGLVFSMAQKYMGQGLDIMDLLQEGNLGLIRAAEKFDPDNKQKSSFGHYAAIWINAKISKGIHRESRTIQVPYDQSVQIQKMRRIEREYANATGRSLSIEELLDKMNEGCKKKMTMEQLQDLRGMEWEVGSLNKTVESQKDGTVLELGEVIADPVALSVEDTVALRVDTEGLSEVIEKMLANSDLTPYERDVVWLYFAEGQEVGTIAKLLSRDKRSVTKTAQSAIKKLQDQLSKGGALEHYRDKLLGVLD